MPQPLVLYVIGCPSSANSASPALRLATERMHDALRLVFPLSHRPPPPFPRRMRCPGEVCRAIRFYPALGKASTLSVRCCALPLAAGAADSPLLNFFFLLDDYTVRASTQRRALLQSLFPLFLATPFSTSDVMHCPQACYPVPAMRRLVSCYGFPERCALIGDF
jgi:hypothetical protein